MPAWTPPPPVAGPASPPRFSPPPVQPMVLELDVDKRRSRPATIASPARNEFYPERRRDWSGVSEAAKKIIVLAVVVVAALGAWRWWNSADEPEEQTLEDTARAQAQALEKAMRDTAPTDCSKAGSGAVFVYTDKKGNDVIVDDIGKVPKQYRHKARCALPMR